MTTEITIPEAAPRNDRILDQMLDKLMRQSFIDYSMSVITDRALPDIRDGLKPVHRRILFAMDEAGNTYNKAYKKSARMVGDVLGKYHPHGDTSVYDAAVRMGQEFSMNHMLIDGQGNFGSIDGDNAAAMRYTEMRLSRLSGEFFKDLYKETVEWRPNYDGSEKEPSVLTVPLPLFLVNGTEGIAVGMASTVLPHNLREVIDATLLLMQDPAVPTTDLASVLKGPDFPTKAIVYNLDGFYSALDTGSGTVRMRARWHEEERPRGGTAIVIDELPYQVNKANLVASIAELVKDKKKHGDLFEDIVDLRDESNKDGIRVYIAVRRDASAEAVFANLAAKTELDLSYSYNCVSLDGGRPKQSSLREMILAWVAFRRDSVRKRFIYDRKQALARLHILEGYMLALGMLDAVISTIRGAENAAVAKTGLIELLGVDEIQAQAILDLKLQRLTGMELDGIRSEHAEFVTLVAKLTEIIESDARIDQVIVEELGELRQRYGQDRQTEIGSGFGNITREDMIPREDVLLTMTRGGYVKRMPANILSRQNRGTRGKKSIDLGDDDVVNFMQQVHSHDSLLVFAKSGQAYGIKAYRIPEQNLATKGRHIRNVIDGLTEEIDVVLTLPEKDPSSTVFTVSKEGTVKRAAVEDFDGASRKGGIIGLGLSEGDALAGAAVVKDEDDIMIVANSGKAIRFNAGDIRVMGRGATGVRGINLDADEFVVGMMVIPAGQDDGLYLLCVGENGVGKRTSVSEFNVQNRGGGGVYAFRANKKTGNLITAMGVHLDQDLVLFTAKGITNRIAVKSISETGRVASGVFLMDLDAGDRLTNATPSVRQSDEDEPAAAEGTAPVVGTPQAADDGGTE